jgi:hypothetical protein
MLERCRVAQDLVTGMQSGGWGTLLVDQLPCALGCLGEALARAEVVRETVSQRTSWFGTSSEVQRVEVYRVRFVPP